jgi:hypothetical protein
VRARRADAGLPADPTDVELECLAQTWSEHCKHKIFAAHVRYTDEHGQVREIDSLDPSPGPRQGAALPRQPGHRCHCHGCGSIRPLPCLNLNDPAAVAAFILTHQGLS